jgi:hypothetical protein
MMAGSQHTSSRARFFMLLRISVQRARYNCGSWQLEVRKTEKKKNKKNSPFWTFLCARALLIITARCPLS